jgi:hypothetical protein
MSLCQLNWIMFCKYQCAYGPKDHCRKPSHTRSIKCGCLAHFLIKQLYTQPKVVEITFYHRTHLSQWRAYTWCTRPWICFTNVFICSTHRSQKLKDYIWNQLGLRYTVKQIYDKHKAIWWARVNVGEPMTKDDFIKAQNIVYWDWKHKRGSWCLHRNPTIFI